MNASPERHNGGSTDSSLPQSERNESQRPVQKDTEFSVLDLLLLLVRNRKLIIRSIFVLGLLGGVYATVASDQYTSAARVVREVQEDSPSLGGISGGIGALRGLGINLGGASEGLSPAAFPEVLESREVRLAVARDTFVFSKGEEPTTFVEHIRRTSGKSLLDHIKSFSTGLLRRLRGVFTSSPETEGNERETTEAQQLSKEEHQAIRKVNGMVSTSVDKDTGLMTITVTAKQASLAAEVTQSFVLHLTRRVQELRTEKIRRQLQFVERRFDEVEQELNGAEEKLASFLERNQNPNTASLEFQEDRLRRQVRFKEQLFSDFQGKLTQMRLDLKQQQPVVTVVEKPIIPRDPSAPSRTLIFLVSIVMGGVLGAGLALMRAFLIEGGTREREKLHEIREVIEQSRWLKTIQKELTTESDDNADGK